MGCYVQRWLARNGDKLPVGPPAAKAATERQKRIVPAIGTLCLPTSWTLVALLPVLLTCFVSMPIPANAEDVVDTWGLVPSGLAAGGKFRLLFVTSSRRPAASKGISAYDAHVRSAAAGGRAALRPYGSHFQALVSTADQHARVHTSTTHTQTDKGVPVYWLGGAKVADDYADFYDGTWDSNAPRDESGEALSTAEIFGQVFTGSASDGTRAAGAVHLGTGGKQVRVGDPRTSGKEIDSGDNVAKTARRPLYGLSGVFTIVAAGQATLQPGSASVDGDELTLSYGADLDTDLPPAAGDFSVQVAGAARSVSRVAVTRRAVTLTLASAVLSGQQVSVGYTRGGQPLRSADGHYAAAFSALTVTNATLPVLSISDPSVAEGAAGTTTALEFEVTLDVAPTQRVTVQYADAGTGTATSGADYTAVTSATLTFEIGDRAKTVSVTVRGDGDDEIDETVVLRLSAAANATLAGGKATLDGTGWILDDDGPDGLRVTATWGPVPTGLAVGEQFRLLFVTSSRRNGGLKRISAYDRHVRDAASRGRAALRPYSSHFRALVSTGNRDARVHTATTHTPTKTGVPIYWLGGAKVADDYADFYDGTWDSNAPRDESGAELSTAAVFEQVFTGSASDGARADGGVHLGTNGTQVRTGDPRRSGKEIDSGADVAKRDTRPLYGLSGVFTIVAAGQATLQPESASVDGEDLTLAYGMDLDTDSTPAAGDFAVQVAGAARAVSQVVVTSRAVTLTLASTVFFGEQVSVSYTQGAQPLRSADGHYAAAFSALTVTNETFIAITPDTSATTLLVPPTWGLVPEGSASGAEFRLLYVTSLSTGATSRNIKIYDRHVVEAAKSGGASIEIFSSHFRALVSTESVEARDHTSTTYTNDDFGVPIYWVAGDKVADDYRDFYDGSWDSNLARDQSGDAVSGTTEVFTGSRSNGARAADGRVLGARRLNSVRVGRPGRPGRELESSLVRRKGSQRPLYGLSGVFRVANDAVLPKPKSDATITMSPESVMEGSQNLEVLVSIVLESPMQSDTDWQLRVHDGTALSPDDFEANPRVLQVRIPAGETEGTGSFEVSVPREAAGAAECDETLILRGSRIGAKARVAAATLTLKDPNAGATYCGSPVHRPPVSLTPTSEPTESRSSIEDGPDQADQQWAPPLGTPARVALWTDSPIYRAGDQVTLYRTLHPMGDDDEYSSVYYLENTDTGHREYFAAANGTTTLVADVVDQYGSSKGEFVASRIEEIRGELIWAGTITQAGSWQFVAEIRSPDGTRVARTAHAKITVHSRPELRVGVGGPEQIASDQTWTKDRLYRLQGEVRVLPGATLSLNSGTVVMGVGRSARIIVERGGRIEVNGTQQQPVVMTCDKPVGWRQPGCWGGLIIRGAAPISDDQQGVGERSHAWKDYGGEDPEHSSGALRFVRLEFGGADESLSMAALALLGVGSGTVLDHVQVRSSLKDGIAFRGGGANCNYCVSSDAGRHLLTWADGWQGSAKHVYLQQGRRGEHGIAARGLGLAWAQANSPALHNATLVGGRGSAGSISSGDGIHLSLGTPLMASNLIVTGFGGLALAVAGNETEDQFASEFPTIRNAILYANGPSRGFGAPQISEGLHPRVEFSTRNPQLRNLRHEPNPDPRPEFGSVAFNSIRPARYLGAFGESNWLAGWTAFGPDEQLRVEMPAELSIRNASAMEGHNLEFKVQLEQAQDRRITVRYRTESGTATQNSDFEGAEGTLAFLPGETEQTLSIPTTDEDGPEDHENLFVILSHPTDVGFVGDVKVLVATGTIYEGDDPVVEVASTWGLVPRGLRNGDEFRLLFVTSTETDAMSVGMASYDAHVREVASAGPDSLQPYAGHFRCLGSAESIDARDHTASVARRKSTGVPIYWLRGGEIAYDYPDFYDGRWGSNEPRDESGKVLNRTVLVFTGSDGDGTRDPGGRYLGAPHVGAAQVGQPGKSGREIAGGVRRKESLHRIYGLSGVFRVSNPWGLRPIVTNVAVNESLLTVTFDEVLDSDSTPSPHAFQVVVSGSRRDVTNLTIGESFVMLVLESAVLPGERVRLSYRPMEKSIKNHVGTPALPLSDVAVNNVTRAVLDIGSAISEEANSGETSILEFEVSLSTPSAREITVKYTDTGLGTATSGRDYTPIGGGTLTFSPGETSKSIRTTIIGDDSFEASETVIVQLRDAVNATLAGSEPVLVGIGTIANDDPPPEVAQVPSSWSAVPKGLSVGDRFRLLFVSSTERNGVSEEIEDYDEHVQSAARNGLAAIGPYALHFRALGSTAELDAQVHTGTVYSDAHSGVPIYWLGGDRVASDYRQFYSGSWSSNSPRDDSGALVGRRVEVFTGSSADGTRDSTGRYLGTERYGAVRVGIPGQSGQEIESRFSRRKRANRRIYGISEVFEVVAPKAAEMRMVSASASGAKLRLRFDEPLDADWLPAPRDFAVTVDASVTKVNKVAASGAELVLTLESVVLADKSLTATFTPRAHPLRSATGTLAAPLRDMPVANLALPRDLLPRASSLRGGRSDAPTPVKPQSAHPATEDPARAVPSAREGPEFVEAPTTQAPRPGEVFATTFFQTAGAVLEDSDEPEGDALGRSRADRNRPTPTGLPLHAPGREVLPSDGGRPAIGAADRPIVTTSANGETDGSEFTDLDSPLTKTQQADKALERDLSISAQKARSAQIKMACRQRLQEQEYSGVDSLQHETSAVQKLRSIDPLDLRMFGCAERRVSGARAPYGGSLIEADFGSDSIQKTCDTGSAYDASGWQAWSGTTARFAVWTDRTAYKPSQRIRLFLSADPQSDDSVYTFFFYLENIRTGVRRYFTPATGTKGLTDRNVDQYGRSRAEATASQVPRADKELIWEGQLSEHGQWQFVGEIRTPDGRCGVKLSHAKFTVSSSEDVVVGNPNSTTLLEHQVTWTRERIYKLRGTIRVKRNALLVIESGTQIHWAEKQAGIVVERGGKIDVRGTRREPVIMTCDAPVGLRRMGCGRGLTIHGRAPVIGNDDGIHGGTDPYDSSGVLRFLRLEFAGSGSPPAAALSLVGVGSGTVIEYVQVHASGGDGLEFRGGTARCNYCVSSGAGGHLLKWSEGWTGQANNLFLWQAADGAGGISATGPKPASATSVLPSISNATLLGFPSNRPVSLGGHAIQLRSSAAMTGRGIVVTGFRGQAISAGGREAQRMLAGGNGVRNAVVFENGGLFGMAQISESVAPLVHFRDVDPMLLNVRYERNPDPRPTIASPIIGACLENEEPSNNSYSKCGSRFAGAFQARNWTEEWTLFGVEQDYAVQGNAR